MSAVDLDEVKAHLNITDTKDDVEIAGMLAAAEAVLGNSVGPLEPGDPETARVTGGPALVLPHGPIDSVASVLTTDSVVVDPATYVIEAQAGLIRFIDGRTRPATYVVTYTAGWMFLPADLELAVKEMVRHLWASQRGASRRPGSTESPTPQPGYLLPYLVEQLIEPYRQIGVGAA